jgi:hypothetical protein
MKIGRGNRILGENLPQRHFVHHKIQHDQTRARAADRRGGKPATNRLSYGAALTAGRFLVLISVRGWVDSRAIVRLEGLGQLTYPVTSSGIESATSRLPQPTTLRLDIKILIFFIIPVLTQEITSAYNNYTIEVGQCWDEQQMSWRWYLTMADRPKLLEKL